MNTQKSKEYVLREKIKRNIFNPPKNINSVLRNLIEDYDKIYKDEHIDQDVNSQKYEIRLRILIYLLYIFYKNNMEDDTDKNFSKLNQHFLMIQPVSEDRFINIKKNIIKSINKQYHLTKNQKEDFQEKFNKFFNNNLGSTKTHLIKTIDTDNINNTLSKKRGKSQPTRRNSSQKSSKKRGKSQPTRRNSSQKSSKKRAKSQPTRRNSSQKSKKKHNLQLNNFFRNKSSNNNKSNNEKL
jgi:hypothetical protein